MALINDDLQRKGNLGGPDLFLAPVGRIGSEKISKFYCNTCEKDFEGAPKIQFENPNEEVAENLILVEKGQYICTTCNSTLAEYREFKKPNDTTDAGYARPMEPPSTSMIPPTEPIQPPSTSMIPPTEPIQQSFTPPSPTVTIPDFEPEILPGVNFQEENLNQSQTSPSFNAIAGMTVFDENAKKIGTVKQVGVDATQNVVLIIIRNDASQISVKWNQIKKVGEIILLGEGQSGDSNSMQSISKCSSCGFDNKPGSKFCQSCGSKV